MASYKQSFTKEFANKGAQLKLQKPDGTEGSESMMVRGMDSDAYQRATRAMRSNIMGYLETHGIASKTSDAYIEFALLEQHKAQAALVISWTFDEPCDEAHVVELLQNAPGIGEQLENFCSKRARFVSCSPTA